jgi:hypothetical protein
MLQDAIRRKFEAWPEAQAGRCGAHAERTGGEIAATKSLPFRAVAGEGTSATSCRDHSF